MRVSKPCLQLPRLAARAGLLPCLGLVLVSALGRADLAVAATHGSEPVTLLYNERPPYLVSNPDGSAGGLTGAPSAKAFHDAGIKVVWASLSTKRQIQSLTENVGMSCAIGWFYKPEREKFAKFTKHIYRDKPFVAIAASGFVWPQDGKLTQLLADKKIRVLLKEGFSYGEIDLLLAKYQPKSVINHGEVVELMQMIKARRADIMFAAREEADYLMQQSGFQSKDFRLIQFPDAPPGKTRHIMCSKKVPDALIKRLNAVISSP